MTTLPNWRTAPQRSRRLPRQRPGPAAESYRVLNADGSIPAEGMLNSSYRGVDLRRRLASEGIEFDADGRASQ